jgi:hypothetical protein
VLDARFEATMTATWSCDRYWSGLAAPDPCSVTTDVQTKDR